MTDQRNDSGPPSDLSVRHEFWRKAIHLLGLSLPLAYVGLGRGIVVPLMLLGCAAVVGADVARILWHPARRWYGAIFGSLTRTTEDRRLTGASMLMLSQTATALLFPSPVVPVAMTFGVVGDVAAALAGRRFGRVHWRSGKSIAGSLACLVVSFLGGVVWMTLPPWVVFAGALAGTLAEGVLSHLDDNLTIPLASGLVMSAFVA